MPKGWQWDETLYQGSAPYYVRGRLPYAPGFAERLAELATLDGHGRLLDVGCGPGVLTLPLARFFAEAVGIDPDAGMLAEAERRAIEAGIGNVRWVRARAEELPADLGIFRTAIFGQSFHWMDRARVAAITFAMLEPGGAFVHVSDVKDTRTAPDSDSPYPLPPYSAIQALIRTYLGPARRAGLGVLPHGTPDNEAAVLSEAGFMGPERVLISAGGVLMRTAEDVNAWVWSRSDSAPHLFGDRAAAFESELRRLLHDLSPSAHFAEPLPDTELVVWRTPRRT